MSRRMPGWPFSELELDPSEADEKTIKRAYARKLKTLDQASQAAEFQALREAYEMALIIATDRRAGPQRVSDAPERLPAAPESSPNLDGTPGQPPSQATPEQAELAALATDWQAVERLSQRIRGLTPFSALLFKWREILDDPVLVDPEAASRIEGEIFALIMAHGIADEDGVLALPDFVTRELVRMLDERFGWLSDYPLFQRKFGYGTHHVLAALQRRRGVPAGRRAASRRTGIQSIHWLAQGFLMFLGYLLFRVIVLNSVLP